MPVTCAPLIFPALDIAAAASPAANEGSTGERIGINIKTQSKSASKFVNDYHDRRAQVSYSRACCQRTSHPLTSILHTFSPKSMYELGEYLTQPSQCLSKPRLDPDRLNQRPPRPDSNPASQSPNNATNTHLFMLITSGRYKAEP